MVHGLHASVRDTLPLAGAWTLEVTSKVEMKSPKHTGKKPAVKRQARQANMAVAFAPVAIRPSSEKNWQIQQRGLAGLGNPAFGKCNRPQDRAARWVL